MGGDGHSGSVEGRVLAPELLDFGDLAFHRSLVIAALSADHLVVGEGAVMSRTRLHSPCVGMVIRHGTRG